MAGVSRLYVASNRPEAGNWRTKTDTGGISTETIVEAWGGLGVVAWPDGDGLIKPKAFVVLKSPEKATDPKAGDAMSRTLQDHVKAKLAPHKYPRWIEFRSDLPKTATGKIQRFKLRAEGAPR